MAIDAKSRRALRSLQRCLASSVPTPMLEDVGRNDGDAWAALSNIEMRMLLARGQTYQARQFAERLPVAAEAGLDVESYERWEIQQLINAIDSVQAGRHFLALHQLEQSATSEVLTIQWAAQMWRARSLAAEDDLGNAREAAARSLLLAKDLATDATLWTTCVSAELQARAGEPAEAEHQVLHTVSQFIGQGEARGISFAYLSLAVIHNVAGAQEESEAAAEMAYQKDGSWTGPVLWLARLALANGDMEEADQLLRSIPNPTTDAYNLLQALSRVEARKFALDAVLSNLALADRASSADVVRELQQLVVTYPRCSPVRETLAWKLLSLGRPEEANEQLRAMILASADGQSVAAVRFGLQTFEELAAEQVDVGGLEEQQDVGFDLDEQTPAGIKPLAEIARQKELAAALERKVRTEVERQKKATEEVEALVEPTEEVERQKRPTEEVERQKRPTEEVERQKRPTEEVARRKKPTAEVDGPAVEQTLARGAKKSGFAGQISLFGIPDLLQFFCGSRKTGMIELSSQRGEARIRLHDGSIYWAVSPTYPSVKKSLKDKEAVSESHLSAVPDDQVDEVGVLVDQEGVDVDKLREALRSHIHLTVRDLIDWLDGWFMFDAIHDAAEPRSELLFNAQGILLDVMREMDEENR